MQFIALGYDCALHLVAQSLFAFVTASADRCELGRQFRSADQAWSSSDPISVIPADGVCAVTRGRNDHGTLFEFDLLLVSGAEPPERQARPWTGSRAREGLCRLGGEV